MKSINKRVLLSRTIIAALVGSFAFAAVAPHAHAASNKTKQTKTDVKPTLVQETTHFSCGLRQNADQVAALVAPIAFYPDALVAQILMASTYPTEIVEASRWNSENGILSFDVGGLQDKAWAPSVKSLDYFPAVLDMTYNKPNWTAELGTAFSHNPELVLKSIQNLRKQAIRNGTVNEKHILVGEQIHNGNRYITVASKGRDVKLPYYSPYTVFKGWPYKSYPPAEWFPRGLFDYSGEMIFGDDSYDQGINLWGDIDWGYSSLVINNKKYNQFIQDNYGNPSTFSPLTSETGWTYWTLEASRNGTHHTISKYAPQGHQKATAHQSTDCSPDIVYTADPSRPIPRNSNFLDVYFGNTPD